MSVWFALPFVIQASLMFFDEFYLHRRRGLGNWERWGHPLDTLSVLLCYVVAVVLPPTREGMMLYGGLAAISCLLVTKDEWVHAREALDPLEHWVHAVLFILHPLTLGIAGFAWSGKLPALLPWIPAQLALTLAFGLYQILYWNFPWPKRK